MELVAQNYSTASRQMHLVILVRSNLGRAEYCIVAVPNQCKDTDMNIGEDETNRTEEFR